MTRSVRNTVARFVGDDDGSLSLLTLGILPAMFVAGGMAVDYMHMEATRVRLQATLDRAVVAAAALSQTRDPEEVVRDYFEKAGLGDRINSIVVDEALNFREVSATASLDVDTLFLKLVGFDTLAAAASGSAIESHTSVEISLVLDVSGSMDSNHRLPRLKTAASNFIDTVLRANQDVAEVSISIVPFSTQVSAGPGILAHFNRQFAHGLSHCVDFGIADFRTADIDLSRSYTQTTHFDTFTDSATPIQWPVCPAVASLDRRILYQSSSADALKGLIGSFAARGNTSIDLGVKWGSFLLDPSSRPVVAAGVSAGTVDADLAGRPLDYGQDDGMKVLIVMSDGANTSQFAMKPGFAAGPSPVWRDPQSKRLSIYDTSRNEWYWQDNSSAKTKPYDNDDNPYNGIGDPVRLDYVELWRDYSLDWLDDAFGRFDSIVYRPEIETRTAEKDSRTHDICSATKAAGIIVFAIGFEADAAGDATLRDCASSDAHFFDVEGLEIEQAFRAISSTINRLRLSS